MACFCDDTAPVGDETSSGAPPHSRLEIEHPTSPPPLWPRCLPPPRPPDGLLLRFCFSFSEDVVSADTVGDGGVSWGIDAQREEIME